MTDKVSGRGGRLRIGPYELTQGEFSGAFADLGVLIPLEAALIAVNGINPTSTLLGVGVAYIAAGWYFRLPMPVQPLKALAVIAIAQALSPAVIAAGALLMSLTMFTLAVTRGVEYLTRVVPMPVVRGVQFALGITLIRNALGMIFSKPFVIGGEEQRYVGLAGIDVSAGLLVGIGSLALLLLLLWRPWLPAAAVVALLGALIGIAANWNDAHFSMGPAQISLMIPGGADLWVAFVTLVIPQIPLTLTNSVIATVDTARSYFGAGAQRVTPVRVSLSVALGNLWAGLAGGLPMCHGCGGLTAHYRLGGRTPASTTLVGVLLIALAIFFGSSAQEVRSLMPYGALGALLMYVGVQHMQLGLDVNGIRNFSIVALVGAVAATPFGNLAIGAGAGLAAYWGTAWVVSLNARQRRPANGTRRG